MDVERLESICGFVKGLNQAEKELVGELVKQRPKKVVKQKRKTFLKNKYSDQQIIQALELKEQRLPIKEIARLTGIKPSYLGAPAFKKRAKNISVEKLEGTGGELI